LQIETVEVAASQRIRTAELVYGQDHWVAARATARRVLVEVAGFAVGHEPPGASALLARLADDDWATLIREAEAALLTPLLADYLRHQRATVPSSALAQLRALELRQAIRHRARLATIGEILETFGREGIETLLLKGAALAWTIYPTPTSRPMADLDLLVSPAASHRAQRALRGLGFAAPDASRRFGGNAHHLVPATRTDNGVTMTVEVHSDALSRDTLSSISLPVLSEPPRAFAMEGRSGLTLGHIDAMRHLAHHLLEPTIDGEIRLIGVVDLLRYATTFHETIDWTRLEHDHAFVLNVLRCVHCVTRLPLVLGRFAPDPGAMMTGAGLTMRPLRAILGSKLSARGIVREIFAPPRWWLHASYAVPPGRSLRSVLLFRHPYRVARWMGLRLAGV
jgi:hypothetical protein